MKQFIYTVEELKAITDLVEAINKFDRAMDSPWIKNGPEILWLDRVLGHVVRFDADDEDSQWGYRPAIGEDGSEDQP